MIAITEIWFNHYHKLKSDKAIILLLAGAIGVPKTHMRPVLASL